MLNALAPPRLSTGVGLVCAKIRPAPVQFSLALFIGALQRADYVVGAVYFLAADGDGL